MNPPKHDENPGANGKYACIVCQEWGETKHKISQMHSLVEKFDSYLHHLTKLDFLEGIERTNIDIRDKLLGNATGIDRIQTKVIMPIIYSLCFMLVAIIVWFTGVEPNLPQRSAGHAEVSTR